MSFDLAAARKGLIEMQNRIDEQIREIQNDLSLRQSRLRERYARFDHNITEEEEEEEE